MQAEKISGLIFAETISALMKAHGLRQVDLATRCGVSQGAVSGWEKGVIPKGDALFYAARALGVTMEHLLTGRVSASHGVLEEARQLSPPVDLAEARRTAKEAKEKLEKLQKILA